MMQFLTFIIKIAVFPGMLFLGVYAMLFEFFDRKMYARMQSRKGPKWYIPFADFLKLISKQSLIPADANHSMIRIMPIISLAGIAAAYVYIPICKETATFSFAGDLIIVLYLLTIPALTQFLAGWYSRSLYATIGASRVVTQMFAYEVPVFMSVLAPSLLSGSWCISEMGLYYANHPLYMFLNVPSFIIALVAAQCKLSRAPFDAPEAETEIVSGPFVEYGGRLLALFRLSIDTETVTLISLISAVFLPFYSSSFALNIILYIAKTFLLLFVMTLMKAVMARLRVNQTVTLCWKGLAPIALIQMIINLIVRGYLK